MSWLETAKNLPVGHKTRADCPECGAGTNTNAAIVNHSHKAYSLYCNACGANPFELKGKLSLTELAHIRSLNEHAKQPLRSIALPRDFSTDIPREGRSWLYKAGITESIWREYNIGYSEAMRRVVLPVYNKAGNLIWFQCRAVLEGQKPKYIQPSRDRSEVLFYSRRDKTGDSKIVLVEDIMSAIRVGKQTPTVSLLGTKISSYQANILSQYNTVYTWLDSDRAGVKGAALIRKRLGLTTDVRNITSSKDPKYLTDNKIREKLNES
jgi:hypothetical protein|tara:strand:- start:25777 stop:26574 length:798 start_codon:yes stop_codon:yes gene_type:complete